MTKNIPSFMPAVGVVMWEAMRRLNRLPSHWMPNPRRIFQRGPSAVYYRALDIANLGGGFRCECGHPNWSHEDDGPCQADDCDCGEDTGATAAKIDYEIPTNPAFPHLSRAERLWHKVGETIIEARSCASDDQVTRALLVRSARTFNWLMLRARAAQRAIQND